MKLHKRRVIVLITLLAFTLSVTGCGYILYPERRTQTQSDVVDGKTVVMDCLWLIVGVVPGVVALLVDGLSGTWYYTEAEAADLDGDDIVVSMDLQPGTNFLMRFQNPAPQNAKLRLTLRDEAGNSIATGDEVFVESGEVADRLAIQLPDRIESPSGKLEMNVNGHVRWSADVSFVENQAGHTH